MLVAVLLTPVLLERRHAALERADRRAAAASTAEDRALRLTVTGGAQGSPVAGSGREPVQAARIRLRLRNSGRESVRVVTAAVDGGPRSVLRLELRPGAEGEVPARWLVRCAEVGILRGPRLMTGLVRGRHGSHDVRLPIPADSPALHLAAVQACDVLLPRRVP